MMREEGREIDTWTEMRRDMQKRYVPTSYSRTMRQKLQRLSQGSLTVEEYYKEIEMTLVRANIEEQIEDTMTHFLSGLNPNIRNGLKLQKYVDILQQMVASILNKAQVEKDEGPEAEALLRILIVVEGPN